MLELWQALVQFFAASVNLVGALLAELYWLALPLFGFMWAIFAIDWRKAAPTLKGGAAIPLIFLVVLIGAAWGGISPSNLNLLGFIVPNFVWQVLAVAVGAGVVLLCGWLQLRAGWFPEEIELFPAPAHGLEAHHH